MTFRTALIETMLHTLTQPMPEDRVQAGLGVMTVYDMQISNSDRQLLIELLSKELAASDNGAPPPPEAISPSVQCAGQERLHTACTDPAGEVETIRSGNAPGAVSDALAGARVQESPGVISLSEARNKSAPSHVLCVGWESILRLAREGMIWDAEHEAGIVAADDLFGFDFTTPALVAKDAT